MLNTATWLPRYTHTHIHTHTHTLTHTHSHNKTKANTLAAAGAVTPTQRISTGTPVHYSGDRSQHKQILLE